MDNGLRAASCFSGIGAPELGGPQFTWLWHAEIEKFPTAVMEARFPDSTNLGDVTADDFLQRASAFGRLDLLVGGPPCQDFSVAGLRAGVAGDRGNLSLRFMEIAHAIRPRNLLVENVPGWLNMPDNAFGCFLGALVGADDALCSPLDGKWPSAGMVAGPRARAAWRVFDAQYFGVAQRRRRVFVVADFGEGADPAAVLFEPQSMSGNTPPRRESGAGVAVGALAGTSPGGGWRVGADEAAAGQLIPAGIGTDNDTARSLTASHTASHTATGRLDPNEMTFVTVAPTLDANFGRLQGHDNQHIDGGAGHFVAHSLRGEGFDASEDGTGRGTPIVPVAFSSKDYGNDATNDLSPTLRSMGHDKSHANGGGQMAIAFAHQGGGTQMSEQKLCARCGGIIVPVMWESILADRDGEIALWKGEAANRSEAMVQLNLDRAAMGVTNMQLREALEGVLPLLEKIEAAVLVGDEGCLWPVEAARAALATEEE